MVIFHLEAVDDEADQILLIRLLLCLRTSAGKRNAVRRSSAIQAMGLKKRLEHTGCKNVTVGISGGLDSTLALLVTARAFDLLGISEKHPSRP